MPGYPILLELAGRRAVVVGLGGVGRRKVAGLLDAGAEVVGVDPAGFPDEPVAGLIVRAEPYREAHLDGARLAFAAATHEVNRRVVADARRRGILVNSASMPEQGDFAVPAVWRDGPIVLGVSTSGAGPSLAALLRDRAAGAIGPHAAGLASLLAELRPVVLARIEDKPARRRLLRDWADPRWLDRWASEGPEAVRRALLVAIDAAASGPADAGDAR